MSFSASLPTHNISIQCLPLPSLLSLSHLQRTHHRYPNSGGYMGYLWYIVELFTERIAIQAKSDCTDDQVCIYIYIFMRGRERACVGVCVCVCVCQGELIKARLFSSQPRTWCARES